MGTATVDLPDPLNPPLPAESGVASTDDLLAQMAGEEIDRLLAEQEGEHLAAPAAPVRVPAPSSVSSPAGQAKPADKESLHDYLGGLTSDSTAGPVAVATPAEPVKSPSAAAKTTAELLDEELAADEARAALSSKHFRESAEPGGSAAGAVVPVPLRVLAWISSPLEACPDHVREAIGKVAIVTVVNAVAILAYALFFRAHHR